ncbi:hypothetical protein [Chryseobacterium sp. P1-3]|uniref:hypothetical protein n=1 Tax=Chryseobacterium sp. (strain P1-3) TaxID=1517683 RepID=UPI000A64E7BB|nr:hypothetical protein [Chryseobacterium sp. P1-3]
MLKIKLFLLFSIVCNFLYAQTKNIEDIEKGISKNYTYEELENEFYDGRTGDVNSKISIAKYYLKKS